MENKDDLLMQYRNIYAERRLILDKMQKIHKKNPYTVNHHNNQKSSVCFIFSCPGQDELVNNRVCFGETGENLDILLHYLVNQRCDVFNSRNRYDYDILNTSNVVHFYALDKKTQAGIREINKHFEEIQKYIIANTNLSYIILFGKKAELIDSKIQKVVDDTKRDIKIITGIKHLGYQALNQIDKDIHGNEIDESHYPTPEARTSARLGVVAQKILSQL